MVRSMLAASALMLVCFATTFAGDCLSCGGGYGHHVRLHGGHQRNMWGGYCGSEGCGDACSDPCSSCTYCGGGGCHHCCFPLIRGAVRTVGRVIDFVIPHPCCGSPCRSRGCGTSCCEPTCGTAMASCGCEGGGMSPGYSHPTPANADPFIDDMPPSTGAPMPMKEARKTSWNSPIKKRTVSTRTASQSDSNESIKVPVRVVERPQVASKPATRSVMKVSHEQRLADEIEARLAQNDVEAAPTAPASIFVVDASPIETAQDQPTPARTVSVRKSSNPLR